MSLLGRLFAHGVDADDDVVLRPSRKFTRQDIVRIAGRGASEFRADAMNLLSCYELEGEFALYSTLGNFVQTKNPMTAEITEAVVDGDEVRTDSCVQTRDGVRIRNTGRKRRVEAHPVGRELARRSRRRIRTNQAFGCCH